MTIIKNIVASADYPIEAIAPDAYAKLEMAIERLPSQQQGNAGRTLRLLECFLQVTSQSLTLEDLKRSRLQEICQEVVGAIFSPSFYLAHPRHRYVHARAFISIFKTLTTLDSQFTSPPSITLSSTGLSEDVSLCVNRYEKLPKDQNKVRIWQGWPTTNKAGQTHWLPLFNVNKRLGTEFCEKIYSACDSYFSAGRDNRVACIKDFDRFIMQYLGEISPANFNDPKFVTVFWREFFEFYLKTNYNDGKGASLDTLISRWRNQFMGFVERFLITPGIITRTYSALPSPEPRKAYGAKTNIRQTKEGQRVKTKLLTPVPLQVSDDEAFSILFRNIREDFNAICQWAEVQAADQWARHLSLKGAGKGGTARIVQSVGSNEVGHKWLTSRDNPKCFNNLVATFENYGFVTREEIDVTLIFPPPLTQTAHELALPTRLTLLPHCAMLVANHPEITESFLVSFRLYDKHGKICGFISSDSGAKLVGYKYRKGPIHAQQIILLNEKTKKIVEQIIALTKPLRDFLYKKGDDAWRYLLLGCGKGFEYPAKIEKLWVPVKTKHTRPYFLKDLEEQLARYLNDDVDRSERVVENFSLTSLRSTAGVLVFLDTGSVDKMAKSLGHTNYNPSLISHYLPEPLLAYFQERWIRLFQTGIIVEAMKDSEYLLEASGFDSMEALDRFLKEHALKKIPKHLESPEQTTVTQARDQASPQSEVVFSVNTGILSILISLHRAVTHSTRPVGNRALYWSEIGKRLINYITTSLGSRPDIQEQLDRALIAADPALVEGLIYE